MHEQRLKVYLIYLRQQIDTRELDKGLQNHDSLEILFSMPQEHELLEWN